MERHKCKLCSRRFSNGRALGGHMKAHLATLPLSPKSFSYSSSSDSDQEALREESLTYSLRENPKKSLRVADPEDRESETESKNPTRQRSKRSRKSTVLNLTFLLSAPPHTQSQPVSHTSPEEDLAMCLMMLSRDTWKAHANAPPPKTPCTGSEIKLNCQNCGQTFRSSRALGSHTSICCRHQQGQNNNSNNHTKVFQCPFCDRLFGSGQALGGHKRSHLIPSSSSSILNDSVKFKQSFIDLNLPAPAEDDDLSVVSDV